MSIREDIIKFATAIGILFPLGSGVWFMSDLASDVADAQTTANAATTTAKQALDATQGIDVIQEQIKQLKRETDEIQQHIVTTRTEMTRKLDLLLDIELERGRQRIRPQ